MVRPPLATSTVEPLLSGHLGFKGCPYLRFARISECIQNSAGVELHIQKQLSNLLVGILYLTTRYIAAAR